MRRLRPRWPTTPKIGSRFDPTNPITFGQVGCWIGNEGCGATLHDYSYQQNDGAFNGSAAWGVGLGGPSLVFTGNNADFILVPFNAPINTAVFTLVAWINLTSAAKNSIFDRDNGVATPRIYQFCTTVGHLQFIGFSSGAPTLYNGAKTVNDGIWHFVAVTIDGSNVVLYVDGALDTSTAQAGPNDTSGAIGVEIGGQFQTGGSAMNGQIMRPMQWNRALSAGEIASLYRDTFQMFRPQRELNFGLPQPPTVPASLSPSWLFQTVAPLSPPDSGSLGFAPTLVRTVPAAPSNPLRYSINVAPLQPSDIQPNSVQIVFPTPKLPAAIVPFDRVLSIAPLAPATPEADLPRPIRVFEPPKPFRYNSPGWLMSLPIPQLQPPQLLGAPISVAQPVIPAPVVFPRQPLDVRALILPDAPDFRIVRGPFPLAPPPPPVQPACALNLGLLRTRVWEQLEDDGTYYTRDQVHYSLNFAQRFFALMTLCIEKTASFNLAGSTAYYTISGQIADFIVPLRASYNGVRVRPVRLGELAKLGTWSTSTIGNPGVPTTVTKYAQQGFDQLAIYPQPPGSASLSLVYAAIPPDLSADSDVPVIPPENHQHLVDFAIWLLRLPEGGAEGTTLTKDYLDRFMGAVKQVAEWNRSRLKALAYDHSPVDADLTDLSRLYRKPRLDNT